jgi:hypothetical protein
MIDFSRTDAKRMALSVSVLALVAVATSGCHVVVPNLGSATVFGYTTSGVLDTQEPYAVGTSSCETDVYPSPIFPTEVAAPTAAYLGTLSAALPSWTFNTAASTLSDKAIEIKTYDAVGTSTQVGVWIHAHYSPHDSDPTSNLHWIQVLTTNHGLRGSGHGPIVTYTDVAGYATATDPYYDTGYAADSSDILDEPNRSDTSQDHTWEATTFLVTGPDNGAASGTVTIQVPGYNWGWQNTCTESGDGLKQFHYVLEEAETFQLPGGLEPGGTLQLRSDAVTHAELRKEQASAPANIVSKQIAFDVSRQIDPGRSSALENARGAIEFASYTFNGKQVPATTAEIRRGSGFIQWESGEASVEFVVGLPLPDGTTEDMVFTGTGQYDKASNSFRLNSGMVGISEAYLKASVAKRTENTKKKR